MRRKTVAIFLILLMILTMAGCGDKDEKEEIPFYSTDEEVFAIETPYCDLFYPLGWANQITIKNEDKDDSYKVAFSTTVDENEIPLFDIVFVKEEGDLIGTLNNNGEIINISMVSHDLELDGYTEDQQIDICGMNEDINVIISKLIENYDFELAQ